MNKISRKYIGREVNKYFGINLILCTLLDEGFKYRVLEYANEEIGGVELHIYKENDTELEYRDIEWFFSFDSIEDLQNALDEDRVMHLTNEQLINLHLTSIMENKNCVEWELGELDGKYIAISKKKKRNYIIIEEIGEGYKPYMTIKIGDTTNFMDFFKDLDNAINKAEDEYWKNDTSYESYYGIKNSESCSCRGGGCYWCEPSRFLGVNVGR